MTKEKEIEELKKDMIILEIINTAEGIMDGRFQARQLIRCVKEATEKSFQEGKLASIKEEIEFLKKRLNILRELLTEIKIVGNVDKRMKIEAECIIIMDRIKQLSKKIKEGKEK